MESSSNYCSVIQLPERNDNESQVNVNHSNHEIKILLNLIKVLKGRTLFLKLKLLIENAEEVFPGEIVNYLEGIQKVLNHSLKHYIMLNELHGEMLDEFSEKFPITRNISHPMLEHKKKILDYSLQINDEIQKEKDFISQLIENNKRWCSLEKEFNESLNIHQHQTENSNSREQAKLQAKKMKKVRLIKVGYEIIWGIMSIHNIDYRKEEEFRNIFYRINKAQNLSLQNVNELNE